MQGLSVGGEYGASATYLSEMAGKGRRGFFSSFQYVTLISGQLLAICVLLILQSTLSEADLDAWGWRIPFAVGALLAVVVFYLRRGLAETESFKNAKQEGAPKSGFWQLIRHHPRETATVMLLTAGGTLAFYAYSIYSRSSWSTPPVSAARWRARSTRRPCSSSCCCNRWSAGLSDRIGRKPIMVAFGIGGLLFTYPIFSTLATVRDPLTAAAGHGGADHRHRLYVDQRGGEGRTLPRHIRALGVALPYALANTIFGGTAEYVALKFKAAGWEQGFYWYVTAMIGVSLIVYLRMRDTARHSQIIED